MKRSYFIFLFLLILAFDYQLLFGQYPSAVQRNLKLAGQNRREMEKVISYFKAKKNPQKIQAVYFLIGNMHNHVSASYYWADANGKKIAFDELQYKGEAAAQLALSKLRQANPKMHTVSATIGDLQLIKASELIDNVNLAFDTWQRSSYKLTSLANFCEYILPYRVSVEPLQPWRSVYQQKYKWISDVLKDKGLLTMLSVLKADQRSFFESTWGKEKRKDPLPRLGAMQLLRRKKGMCEDGVAFTMFSLRSQGIPCAQNIVPYWATSTGGHFFLTVFDPKMKPIAYDQANTTKSLNRELIREPGKVFMLTYSAQARTLASIVTSKEIPDGLLRLKNYVDVTAAHWPVADLGGRLKTNGTPPKTVYACVFNGLKWQPIWWSKVANGSFTFTKMGKGVVYLPCKYKNEKMEAVGDPIALGYNNRQQLTPDKSRMKPIILSEQEGYLQFRPGSFYKLYYWDGKWILADKQLARPMAKQLLFKPAPSNALYLLLPERAIGKERPFMITPTGQRVWF